MEKPTGIQQSETVIGDRVEKLTEEIIQLSEETKKLTALRDNIQRQLDSRFGLLVLKRNELNELSLKSRLKDLEETTIYQLDSLTYQQLRDLMSLRDGHKDISTAGWERVTESDLIPVFKLWLRDHSCRYCKKLSHMKDSCPKLMKFKCDACGQHGHTIAYCRMQVRDLEYGRVKIFKRNVG